MTDRQSQLATSAGSGDSAHPDKHQPADAQRLHTMQLHDSTSTVTTGIATITIQTVVDASALTSSAPFAIALGHRYDTFVTRGRMHDTSVDYWRIEETTVEKAAKFAIVDGGGLMTADGSGDIIRVDDHPSNGYIVFTKYGGGRQVLASFRPIDEITGDCRLDLDLFHARELTSAPVLRDFPDVLIASPNPNPYSIAIPCYAVFR